MAGETVPFGEREREDGFAVRLRVSSKLEELRQRQYQRELAEAEAERVRRIKEKETKAYSVETDAAIGRTALREAVDSA